MSLPTEYDSWHQRQFDAAPGHDDAESPWYELIEEYLGNITGARILEVACGRGGFLKKLEGAGARVVGCDFSLAALRIAREKTREVVQGDAANLPFADNSFDLVISCETIEHVPDVQAALSEMHRVAKKGGQLFLTTPNYLNLMGLYEIYCRFRHPGRKDDQPFDRRQLVPQIRRWVKKAGWKIVHTDGTVHQFPIIPGHNPVRWKSIESNRTMRKLLSPFALTYFVMAKK